MYQKSFGVSHSDGVGCSGVSSSIYQEFIHFCIMLLWQSTHYYQNYTPYNNIESILWFSLCCTSPPWSKYKAVRWMDINFCSDRVIGSKMYSVSPYFGCRGFNYIRFRTIVTSCLSFYCQSSQSSLLVVEKALTHDGAEHSFLFAVL